MNFCCSFVGYMTVLMYVRYDGQWTSWNAQTADLAAQWQRPDRNTVQHWGEQTALNLHCQCSLPVVCWSCWLLSCWVCCCSIASPCPKTQNQVLVFISFSLLVVPCMIVQVFMWFLVIICFVLTVWWLIVQVFISILIISIIQYF